MFIKILLKVSTFWRASVKQFWWEILIIIMKFNPSLLLFWKSNGGGKTAKNISSKVRLAWWIQYLHKLFPISGYWGGGLIQVLSGLRAKEERKKSNEKHVSL